MSISTCGSSSAARRCILEDVLKLKRGSVVTLDKLAGDPVDVFVNGRLVARGEVLVLNDNFCVRVTELLDRRRFRLTRRRHWNRTDRDLAKIATHCRFARPAAASAPLVRSLSNRAVRARNGRQRPRRFRTACRIAASFPAALWHAGRRADRSDSTAAAAARCALSAAQREQIAANSTSPPRPIAQRRRSAPSPAAWAIVLGLFLVLVWCSRRFAPAGAAQLPKEAVELLGRALARRHGSKCSSCASATSCCSSLDSPTGAETLTEITDAAEVEHLAAPLPPRPAGQRHRPRSRQVLTQLASEPAHGGFVGDTRAARREVRR